MSLSRSDSRQYEKAKRKKQFRNRLSLILILFGVVIIIVGTLLVFTKDNSIKSWIPFIGNNDNRGSITNEAGVKGNKNGTTGKVDVVPEATDEPKSGGEESGEVATGEEKTTVEPIQTDAVIVDEETNSGSDERISLSFVGDLLPGEYVTPFMTQHGYGFPYEKAMLYLSEPDLLAGNLELPITKRGTPLVGNKYVYKGLPEALPALRDAGFDVFSLANNHALDQGVEGMVDTMTHLDEAGISHMGTGNNDTEAFAPVIKEVNGIKVAYIGVSNVIPFAEQKADRNVAGIAETYETTRTVKAIKSAKEKADIVVLMVHWGVMGADMPEPYQKNNARIYIDAGADLVIGSHPHVLQGFEKYKGKWIAYSLGNFVFTNYPKDALAETGVLDAACSKKGDCELSFYPMKVTEVQPTPLEGEEAKALLDRLTSISFGVKLEEDGSIVEK
ncbi:CapA family protein [Paenibacillus sp. GSMTC-2017]|uniref:CapA family protein n=1 Tax=Paenibacillus sp. GSMTC-2017 TaxID=2794350 RepID=UPI0018D70F83|nr:CapA family protein [Paenibacillus sp. GSMTC-2017]MBH5318220.1 CapA family protein [Paenibacillus sp. GSMTC-2017]